VQKVAAAIVMIIEKAYPIIEEVYESVKKLESMKESETWFKPQAR